MTKISLTVFILILSQIICLQVSAQTASITCPANVMVSTALGKGYAIVNNIDPVVSPSNASLKFTISGALSGSYVGSASGMSFPVGVSTIAYTLNDYPGISCSFTITVVDNEPPVIYCPANTAYNCAADVPPRYLTTVTATDNSTPENQIKIEFVSETKTNQTCLNKFSLTRTYRATDASGNSATCSQVITVNDTEAPVFKLPPPTPVITVASPADVPVAVPDGYTATDYCIPIDEDPEVPVTFKEVKSDSTCPNKYTLIRTWTATDICGNTKIYEQVIYVKDTIAPVFDNSNLPLSQSYSCASDISSVPAIAVATDNSPGQVAVTFKDVKSEEQCANKFKLTRTWTATDVCGNSSTYVQVFTVNDTQAPVFTSDAPAPVSVACEKDIPAAVTQTATDNCGTPVISFSEVKSNVQCANRFTLTRTWTAADACGNKTTRSQVITVYDNQLPTLSGISVDTVTLWPPNHKMRDVTVNYTVTDNCAASASLSVSSSEAVNGGSDGDQAPDWEVVDAHHVRLRAEKANNGQARYYTIKITVTDSCNTAVTDSVTVVVAHNITGPKTGNPYKIGTTVPFDGTFWDKPGNIHTAKWLLDGNDATNGTVTEPSVKQNGKLTGSYKFKNAGVYKLQMNITDQKGLTSYANTNDDLEAIVVVYDPNGGYTYGGGWFNSPSGALKSNPALTGKVSYGFTLNYFKNATLPKGETQFEFKLGDFEYNAVNFDYLSISGARAQFKGTGKIIGGQSGVNFITTIIDGDLDGTGIDKIRMKIYNKNTGQVYYDNEAGNSDAANPATSVGLNSTIVIGGTSNAPTTASKLVDNNLGQLSDFDVKAYPNPATDNFKITVNSNSAEKVLVKITDILGRTVEQKTATPGQVFTMGDSYRPGTYIMRIIQGTKQKEIKLTKLKR